ncbi:MAG: TonB-dependent receptor [Flavobacteriales bacterium]
MKKLLRLFAAGVIILSAAGIKSQSTTNATVRGFVYNKKNGEPAIFTNVLLKGTTNGASTDVNGYYSITRIPPGNYTITIVALGFDTLQEQISLSAGQILNKNLYIKEKSIELKTFEISAEKDEERTQVRTSVQTLTPKEINKLPTVGAEPDLAQYLQVLPGVTFTGDQGGQLFIRGGSPVQNKVLLDGMIVYNPFHSIGLFSVFDTDIIRNAEVYTGGFGAEFGGRISSIMKITSKDGDRKRHGGKVSVSPFVSKLNLEGPIKRQKEGAAGSISYVLSGRTSYLEQTSKVLYPYADTAGLPFNFTDLYGKISFNGDNGSKLNISGFNFTDNVTYRSLQDLSWRNTGFGTNFILIPGNSPVLLEGVFSYSDYGITLNEVSRPSRSSDIAGFNFGLNFKYFIGKNELTYGFEAIGFRTQFRFFNELNRLISIDQNTTELNGFVKYRINAGKFVFEPSFRVQYYASLAEVSPEPRIGGKYNVTDNFRVKAAAGLYSQNLIAAVSDRDVVNLFYGFLAAPDNLPSTFDGEPLRHNLQKATHLIGGFELDLSRNISLNAEVYQINFNQLTNINRNKIFEDIPAYFNKPDILKKDFIIETGIARGFDLVMKYDYKRFYFWTVYSLLSVTRFDGVQEYRPHFDRRHNVNLVASYQFGKGYNWEFNVRWNYGSGFPFTQTQGFYENPTFANNLMSDYSTSNGTLGIEFANLNQGRLPDYHRLDINLKRTVAVGTNAILELTAGATNAYNRQNIFFFDRVKFERIDQLPILPSVGANLKF